MAQTPIYFRDTGTGPSVVCLHSNASQSSQWRELTETLAPRFRVLAPDAYGSGKSPDWPSDQVITLADEVDFMAPVLATAGARFNLVGHSYGAAVALRTALTHPGRVQAMALYEPTLFSLLDAASPSPNAADGIRQAVQASVRALQADLTHEAARHFIDYWMGEGSWAQMPEARKPAIAASTRNVRRWGHALMTEPTPLAAFAQLQIPVLYMVGNRSPASAQAVADLLCTTLPQVQVVRFESLGHMAPLTHPAQVNAVVADFLDRHGRP